MILLLFLWGFVVVELYHFLWKIMIKIKKQKLLNFLLHALGEIDLLELTKFITVQLKKEDHQKAIENLDKMIEEERKLIQKKL